MSRVWTIWLQVGFGYGKPYLLVVAEPYLFLSKPYLVILVKPYLFIVVDMKKMYIQLLKMYIQFLPNPTFKFRQILLTCMWHDKKKYTFIYIIKKGKAYFVQRVKGKKKKIREAQ